MFLEIASNESVPIKTVKLGHIRGILAEDPSVIRSYSTVREVLEIAAADIFYACTSRQQKQFLFSLLKWKASYEDLLNSVLKGIGLVPNNFVAVHLRGLDGDFNTKKMSYPYWIREKIEYSCSWNVTVVNDIISQLGLTHQPLYLASDGQLPDIEATYLARGALSFRNISSKIELAAKYIDFFILSEARLLFGNFISTFSNNAASMLLTKYPESSIVISFPPICNSSRDFWDCSRYAFWCI